MIYFDTSFLVSLIRASRAASKYHALPHYESGLRAPDALHLAVAANNFAEAIYTLDASMFAADNTLGLPVSMGI